jgi:UDP-glucose 4-epimerase
VVNASQLPDSGFSGALVVVTGGLGFIGSNTVRRLHDAGATVRVVDSLVEGHGGDRRNLAGLSGLDIEVLVADIGDEAVGDYLEGVDVIFNLAGQVSHQASMRDPAKDMALNAMSHCRLLETLRRVNRRARVVHASTRQVYGRALRLPVDESHPANPIDVNGVAKLAGEQLHMVYAHAYEMALSSLRLTNVYGPRQHLLSDELGFLPVFFRRALTNQPIEIFGDGEQRRDCLFVDDVVDALFHATSDAAAGRVYNVGHDQDYSLAELAEIIVRRSASTGGLRLTPWPPEHQRIDIGSFRSDSSLIAAELGWKAQTNLVDGVDQTIEFYRANPWYLSSI